MDELTAKVNRLPQATSSSSSVSYYDLSVQVPRPPGPLRATIRGQENAIDPATEDIQTHRSFVLQAEFRAGEWIFREYRATEEDLRSRTSAEVTADNNSPVLPSLIYALGLKTERSPLPTTVSISR